ncbi:CDP-alcohol phosphatidyltransferase family protein [Burkholderia sp. FERM BP-3421]|uniref:CDP-alcohol phosphatidyltransferase family protein n=1 Tax=Burkholderia sp. FERM BP-3421 TaxID=1494466 RepID=UPI00236182CF|nr:CDP-alcohol phosphatidyltransferase family protein [Burkholderia sp. FERM BP-3421]WDD91138.1 CDP-alcohol phosphatidyltransferase family protein [Burkholderia sp. FERM BP-3421]
MKAGMRPDAALFSLANLITLGSLSASLMLMSLVAAGHFAPIGALFVAALACDGLDGFVARARGTTGPLGERLDSLIDVVSFGILPPVVAWAYCGHAGAPALLPAMFVYLACAAIRLGRFNIQPDKSVFFGLNSPTAATLVILPVCVAFDRYGATPPAWFATFVNGSLVLAGLLMISPFTYVSTKKLRIRMRPLPLLAVATGVAGAFIALGAGAALYALVLLYTLSGPGRALAGRVRGRA